MKDICDQRAAYKEFKEAVVKAAIFDNPNIKKGDITPIILDSKADLLCAKKAYTGAELTPLLYKLEQAVNCAYLTAKGRDIENLPWVWPVAVNIEAFNNMARADISDKGVQVVVTWDYETNMVRVHKS